MKDVIFSENIREEEILLKGIADMTIPAKVAQISSFVDFARRYN